MRLVLALLLVLLMPVLPVFAASKAEVEAAFKTWLRQDFWPDARAKGISEATLKAALSEVALDWSLNDLQPPGFPPQKEEKQTQAEFSSPAPYFNEDRLRRLAATGRGFQSQYSSVLSRIEKRYGVPGPILLAIWGRETGFGAAKIPKSAVSVLATKAFMGKRRDMFRTELVAALHIIDGGDVALGDFKGSAAGALGQPQFMPTSYLKYAVDFDGDGHRNLWTSVPDTLASIANFLVAEGWERGRGWGFEAVIAQEVSCAQEGPDRKRPISQWLESGMAPVGSGRIPPSEKASSGMMLVPAGRDGPGFVVTPNFYVLKEYNNSDLYALFIGNLADRIGQGAGAFKTPWNDVGHMLRSDVAAMQRALEAQGYDVGGTDGLPGYKTRRAIGEWQIKHKLPPTCYPDPGLLQRLKS